MREVTRKWTEAVARQVYIGMLGYDDPCYETQRVQENFSETYIEFEDSQERKDFWCKLRSYRELARDQVTKINLHNKRLKSQYKLDIESADKNYIKALFEYNKLSLWARLFKVDRPQYVHSESPKYLQVPVGISLIANLPDQAENFIVTYTKYEYAQILASCQLLDMSSSNKADE